MKNTKKKLNNQSRVVKATFQQVDLESFAWDYLVKVKLKNLEKLLQAHRSGIKTKEGGRYENQHERVWAQCVHITQISDIKGYAPTMGKEKQKV